MKTGCGFLLASAGTQVAAGLLLLVSITMFHVQVKPALNDAIQSASIAAKHSQDMMTAADAFIDAAKNGMTKADAVAEKFNAVLESSSDSWLKKPIVWLGEKATGVSVSDVTQAIQQTRDAINESQTQADNMAVIIRTMADLAGQAQQSLPVMSKALDAIVILVYLISVIIVVNGISLFVVARSMTSA